MPGTIQTPPARIRRHQVLYRPPGWDYGVLGTVHPYRGVPGAVQTPPGWNQGVLGVVQTPLDWRVLGATDPQVEIGGCWACCAYSPD